jgi:hypothetical protein
VITQPEGRPADDPIIEEISAGDPRYTITPAPPGPPRNAGAGIDEPAARELARGRHAGAGRLHPVRDAMTSPTSAVVVAVVTRGRRYIVTCRHRDCGHPVAGTTVLACSRYDQAQAVAWGHERAHTLNDAPATTREETT